MNKFFIILLFLNMTFSASAATPEEIAKAKKLFLSMMEANRVALTPTNLTPTFQLSAVVRVDADNFREEFKLVSVEKVKDENEIVKIYKPVYPEPIYVKYAYFHNDMDNEYELDILLDEENTQLLDLTKFPLLVGNDKSIFVKKFNIPSIKPKEDCGYTGHVLINIESIELHRAEIAWDGDKSLANVTNVLAASEPEITCNEYE